MADGLDAYCAVTTIKSRRIFRIVISAFFFPTLYPVGRMNDKLECWHRYPEERPKHGGWFETMCEFDGRIISKDLIYAFANKRFAASGGVTDGSVVMWREVQTDLLDAE